jgi:hypothetical protein
MNSIGVKASHPHGDLFSPAATAYKYRASISAQSFVSWEINLFIIESVREDHE